MTIAKKLRPQYYGGEDDPFEARKVIRAWNLNFNMGNVVKYTRRAGQKTSDKLEDLMKAYVYLGFEIEATRADMAEDGGEL